MHPVVVLQGVSHWGFASGDMPVNVSNNDLRMEVSEDVAHGVIAVNILQFVQLVEMKFGS